MTDAPRDREAATTEAGADALRPWSGAADQPTWTPIAGQAAAADPSLKASPASSAASGGIERMRTLAADRPEIVVGAAFASGLVLATILKRLGR